jgi:hypothetical protein
VKVTGTSKKTIVRFEGAYSNMQVPHEEREVASTDVLALDIPDDAVSFQFLEKETVVLEDGSEFNAWRELGPVYELHSPEDDEDEPL